MEFLPRGLKSFGDNPLDLLHKLKNCGFKLQIIDEINRCISCKEMAEIIELCETEKGGRDSVNLLLEK